MLLRSCLTDSPIADVPAILGMIKDLAIYEKELDKVEATEESLLSSLSFAPSVSSPNGDPVSASRPARTLLIHDGTNPSSTVVGMALYFYNYSTWTSRPGIYLEDLYVKPETRGKGHGTMLLSALAKEVLEMGGARLEWSVLKWNTPSIKFYESIGAKGKEEWMGMRGERKK